MRVAAIAVVALIVGGTAMASGPGDLEAGPDAVVATVTDGDTVTLDDGRELRLVGIMAPQLSLGRAWVRDQPLAAAARAALKALVQGRRVGLRWDGPRVDRHGRLLAHLVLADGTWVEGRMLELGLARVDLAAGDPVLAAEMLGLERQARDAGAGLWGLDFYAVRDAGDPESVPIDAYEIVEGRVVSAADVDRRVFLNFGGDWKSDVTATIAPQDRAVFRSDGLDPLSLEGHLIRVRGWTGWRNGPMIPLVHPDQIEVLD
jgi:endonuclease YncB( thermonuclease family)